MSDSLRYWMNIVEAAISAELLNKVSPYTDEGRKNSAYIAKLQREIEDEESGFMRGFGKHAEFGKFEPNTSAEQRERNEHYLMLDKLKKYERQHMSQRQNELNKQRQEQQAEIDGYKQAGSDEYKDYMGKVKKHISARADKKVSKLTQQRKAISVMAKRKLK